MNPNLQLFALWRYAQRTDIKKGREMKQTLAK